MITGWVLAFIVGGVIGLITRRSTGTLLLSGASGMAVGAICVWLGLP